MREAVVLILLAFCFLQESQGVWVMDGDLSFPLEAVKVLKHLLGANTMSTPTLQTLAHMPFVPTPTFQLNSYLYVRERGPVHCSTGWNCLAGCLLHHSL
uniref:Uncharacterized protein n=1 Tax=Anguilla anguilla TaxID=7936 RepID=A0A0E9T3S9_ANGAN